MSEDIKRWCAAMRSGEYKQGRGMLKDSDGCYCALGVLGEVLGYEVGHSNLYDSKGEDVGYEPLDAVLGGSGITNWVWHLNDGQIVWDTETKYRHVSGLPFSEIADTIEKFLIKGAA